MKRSGIVGIVFLSMEIAAGMAEGAVASEKRQYHLFNPVPRELMREMSTDRPDKTESAYTVDAGHYQIEMSFIDYVYDRHNPTGEQKDVDVLSIAPVNVKAGLTNNVDLQFVMNPYIRERSDENSAVERKSGFGDIQTRVKINVWGNDGGSTAFAVMPFVKFPTNSDDLGNNAVEGGIILPLAVSLPADWNMGIMTEFDVSRNDAKDYYPDFINSITFGHQVMGNLNGYVEFFSSFNQEEDTSWIGTVDMGLTYAVSEDIQLDGGVNIGVTRSADDFNPFLGCSVRY